SWASDDRSVSLTAAFLAPRHDPILGADASIAAAIGAEVAALHHALATTIDSPAFAPEPFTEHFQQALAFGMGGRLSKAIRVARDIAPLLSPRDRRDLERLVADREFFESVYRPLQGAKLEAARSRVHGALTLRVVAVNGETVCFRSFDGDPTRPLSERRLKHSPLRDVASALASCHDAAQFARSAWVARGADPDHAADFATRWFLGFSATTLAAYLARAAATRLLPPAVADTLVVLRAFLADRFWSDILAQPSDPDAVGRAAQGLLTIRRQFSATPEPSAPGSPLTGVVGDSAADISLALRNP
ncbi:MAG: hypothetical protein NZ518_05105, partial [Dehalococcoidia bacterium]|nr:hypothetical protein [Dehalococcoidia bacterium]